MKKLLTILTLFVLVAFIISSCQKEQLNSVEEEVINYEREGVVYLDEENILSKKDDTPVTTTSERGPVAFGPDLVISYFSSNLPLGGPCAIPVGSTPLPNVSCNGGTTGSRVFTLKVLLTNIGTKAVAPGTTDVDWQLVGSGSFTDTFTHSGIAVGSSISRTVTFALPCATVGPPIAGQIISWIATADLADWVIEIDETNNASRPYRMCDDI